MPWVGGTNGRSPPAEAGEQLAQLLPHLSDGMVPEAIGGEVEADEGGEDDDDVEAGASLLGPVHVLQVEPESVLVEDQRGTDPVADGEQRVPAGLVDGECDEADQQQD